MQITWHGHSCFLIESGQARILIDPFFDHPGREGKPDFDELTHIALTHGHFDHVGSTVDIAKSTGATVLANFDLSQWLQARGVENIDMGNTGGTVFHEGFSMTWVNAVHSSATLDENGVSHDLGDPNGLVFHFDDGPAIYHMGDTDIFGDMALIHELHRPLIGLVPVGDRFTMGGAVAALACRRFFEFETVIPCHFGSFPIIDQTADKFVEAMEGAGSTVKVLEIGAPWRVAKSATAS